MDSTAPPPPPPPPVSFEDKKGYQSHVIGTVKGFDVIMTTREGEYPENADQVIVDVATNIKEIEKLFRARKTVNAKKGAGGLNKFG